MMKTIYFLILILLVSNICKADTIDYWHVYYNKTKIKEFNQISRGKTLVFKIANIKKKDSITVKYFRDTPCFDCVTSLTAEDEKHYVVVINHGKGTFNPVSFSLADILRYKEQNNKDYFEVYYYETHSVADKILLFRMKLE